MLTNVGRERVSENIKERKENLWSFMLFDRFLWVLFIEHMYKIIKNHDYVSRNWIKILNFIAKLLKTTVVGFALTQLRTHLYAP